MKKARRQRCDMQDYMNQRYVGSELDDGYFDALSAHPSILYNDGLDAPDFIPCGAMRSGDMFYDRITFERGTTLAQQKELDWLFKISFYGV